MSKKKNRTGNSDDLIKNIGKRLGGEKNKDEEKETNSSNDNENKDNEEKNISADIKEETSKYDARNGESNAAKKDDSAKNSWFDEQEPYRSSFIVKPKMETNFEDCKKKFRRELRMNLSKQNAIELGWLLLKKLKDSDFEKVRKTSSPDDDLVEALKEVIEEYY